MKQEIKKLLNERGIHDPLVLKSLEDWFTACIRASKECGKRSSFLTTLEEVGAWNRVYQASVDKSESDNSEFAKHNFKELQNKYRIILRKQ